MVELRTLKDTTATISDEVLAAFKTSFSGRVIAPGDDAYDVARKVWNSLIDRRPGLIAQARGLADVVAATVFARTHGLLVSVRGGGHNVSGSAVCDGGIVIDLSSLNAAALAGMVKMSNEKVNVRDAGNGGTIEGYATQHKVVTASADMNISAQPMHLEVTMESWTTDKVPTDAASFLQRRLGSTGFPMLDKLIAAQSEAVKGFPLRQVTRMKVGQGAGSLIEMTSTTNVTNVRKTNVAPSLFVVPADYKKIASPVEKMMGQ